MATVSAPSSAARLAMMGAAPVPVPPPRPAATKTMSAPSRTSIPARILQGRLPTDVRVAAGSKTVGELGSDLQLYGRPGGFESLRVGIGHDEFNGFDAGVNHSVDCVGPAASDTDDLDDSAVGGRLVQQKLD